MKQEIRVAVNGYGVIGKRVADAVTKQQDMRLVGVVDVVADWRPKVALSRGMALFAAAPEHAEAMRKAGLKVAGTLEDVLGQVHVVVDCTPKRIAAKNVETYRKRSIKFIVEGGEKHATRRASFPAIPPRRCARCPRSSVPDCCVRRGARCCGAPPIRGRVMRAAS